MAKTPQRLIDYRSNKCRKEVYFSHQDMKEFEQIAKKEGIKVGVVIRHMALAYLQNRRLPTQDEQLRIEAIEDGVNKLSLLVRNIANNVNQIAHRSNTLNVMIEEQDLLNHLKDLDDLIRGTVKKQLKDLKNNGHKK